MSAVKPWCFSKLLFTTSFHGTEEGQNKAGMKGSQLQKTAFECDHPGSPCFPSPQGRPSLDQNEDQHQEGRMQSRVAETSMLLERKCDARLLQ